MSTFSIAATTGGPPVVVTTTAPHNFVIGAELVVSGAANPAVNGNWIAGDIPSATTVQLYQRADPLADTLAMSAGASFAGAAGAAGGTISWSARFPWAAYLGWQQTILSQASKASSSVSLSDMDHTVGPLDGHRFALTEAPAAVRTITLSDVVPQWYGGANNALAPINIGPPFMEFLVRKGMATGQQYKFKRADATPIAEIWGNAAGDAGAWVQFEYISGVWRLGPNCGGGSAGGVLAQAGA